MRKLLGYILLVPGAWALIAPQARLGLKELKWMSRYAFPGEAIAGMAILIVAYYLSGNLPPKTRAMEDPTDPEPLHASAHTVEVQHLRR